MKRFLVLFLVISIFCFSLIPNVSASTDVVDESFLNYWDFSNSESSYYLSPSNDYTVTFDLPRELYIRYVDITIFNYNYNIDSVTVVSGDVSVEMNKLQLNDGFYRFYCSISGGSSAYSDDIKFVFDTNGTSTSIAFHNFTFSLNRYYFDSDIPVNYVIVDNYSGTSSGSISSYSYSFNFPASNPTYPTADPYNYNFGLYLPKDDWSKYDELRVTLYSKIYSISSFTVTIGELNVPFEVSAYNSLTGHDNLTYNSTSDFYYLDFVDGLYSIDLTIDLTGINKADLTDSLWIRVKGSRDINVSSFITVNNVFGYVSTYNINPLSFWFTNLIDNIKTQFKSLRTTLTNLFTASDSQQNSADEFNDSVAEQGSALQDLTADLNSASRPPVEDVNLSVNSMVDQSSVMLATSGLGSLLNNSIILRVLLMSLTFALAGFILFGKR